MSEKNVLYEPLKIGDPLLRASDLLAALNVHSQEVNAFDFGAKFDGTTDDTVALQAAIDYALDNGFNLRLPKGCANITSPLIIGSDVGAEYTEYGFSIFGSGKWYNGFNSIAGGTCIRMIGTGKSSIFQINKGPSRGLSFADFSIVANTVDGASTGFRFPDSVHSATTFRRIFASGMDTLFKLERVTGSNGEFVTLDDCTGNDIRCLFDNAHNQSFGHKVIGGGFGIRANGTVFRLRENSGLTVVGMALSFFGTGNNTVLRIDGGNTSDPCIFVGGRWEGANCAISFGQNGSPNLRTIATFNGVILTSVGGDLANFVHTDDGESAGSQSIAFSDCILDAESVFAAEASPLRLKLRYTNVSLVFDRCNLANLYPAPVIASPSTNRLSSGTKSFIEFKNCKQNISSFTTTLNRSFGKQFRDAGIQENYLLASNFRASSTDGTNVAADSPWVHFGTSSVFNYIRTHLGTSNLPSTQDAYGRDIRILGDSGAYQDVTNISLNVGTPTIVYYRIRCAVVDVATVRISLSNSVSGYVYDSIDLISGNASGLTEICLQDVCLTAIVPANTTGYVRVKLEVVGAGAGVVYMTQQGVYLTESAKFALTTSTVVEGRQEWDSFSENSKILNRLQIPYKVDASGSANATLLNAESEVYLSSDTLREMLYTDRWESRPRQDVGSAAPTTGTWPLGFIRWNSAGSNPIAWRCDVAGTPGTWTALVPNATHTGDLTGATALTLNAVNSNVGVFGGSSKGVQVTVNAKGLVTAISEGTATPAIANVTGLGTGVATFLATPSSANLAAALTDETGSGSFVLSASPTITGDTSFVSANNSTSPFVTFYANNLTLGLGLAYNSVSVVGSNANIDISVVAKGTGNCWIGGNTPSTGVRVRLLDTANTIWFGANSAGITANSGGTIFVGQTSSSTLGISVNTTTGKCTFPATTTSAASINVPHGTAPTSPVNGDIWTTSAGLFVRINGATVGPLT